MSILYFSVGIQGSGKSTFLKRFALSHGFVYLATDELRKEKPERNEKDMWIDLYKMTGQFLEQDKDVVMDATMITPATRKRMLDAVQGNCQKAFHKNVFYFEAPLELCRSRVAKRNLDPEEHHLPVEVVDSFFSKLIPPTLEEGFDVIVTLDESGNTKKIVKIDELVKQ